MFLAWWRSVVAQRAHRPRRPDRCGDARVPAVAEDVETWPYDLPGAGCSVLGAAFVLYGCVRQPAVDDALAAGGYAPPGRVAVAALTGAGLAPASSS